jgi:hypothetical protein
MSQTALLSKNTRERGRKGWRGRNSSISIGINLSSFFKFPSLDGRGVGEGEGWGPYFHPHLTSPVKGEELRSTCGGLN